jgi:hypothetical protein
VTSLLQERLRNQKLAASTLREPADIVSWLGAVQAQDYLGAIWALALRGRNLEASAIERAFTEGTILRTHVLRPTWHFVTPADIGWMVALTAPRLLAMNRTYGRKFGVEDRAFTRARTTIERALEGGRFLTRSELGDQLRRRKLPFDTRQLSHVVFDAELQGAICSGPRRGKQFTYALLAERAPKTLNLSREDALAELASRYFQGHGPATTRDFSWWSGLTMKDAAAGIALSGTTALAKPPALERARGATFLLPNYDEYLIAYRDRGAVLDPARSRNFGVFTSLEYPHQVVVDGRVAGSWRRTIGPQHLSIRVKPYVKLRPADVRVLTREAERYARFLDLLESELTVE